MGLFDSKRPKSALMRDRAYKSNEPHEQAYVRKTRPKNPRYMADGGGVDYTDYKSLLEEEIRLYAEYNKAKADGENDGSE